MELNENISPYVAPGIVKTNPTRDDVLEIIDGVIEKVFNVQSKDLRTKSRLREIVVPRQTYMALLVDFANKKANKQPFGLSNLGMKLFDEKVDGEIIKDPGFSLQEIGDFFNKDHATVLHSRKAIVNDWIYDKSLGFGDKVRMAYSKVKLQLIQIHTKDERVLD